MERGIYVATSGGMAQERAMEIISNNLANMNTTAFKADRLVFSSYVQKAATPNATPPAPADIKLGYASIGNQDTVYKIGSQGYTDFTQGSLLSTGNPLDVALDGDGFIAVQTPDGEAYTRGGSLKLDPNGTLVTSQGYAVLDVSGQPIRVDENYVNQNAPISIQGNGSVMMDGIGQVGTIKVVDFQDKSQLEKVGLGTYRAPDSAQPQSSTALVKQGFLEASNINGVAEMTRMITGLRAYESFQKVIQSHDEINQRLISDVAR